MKIQRQLRLAGEENMDVETSLKVAFASTDMQHIDQHFGAAQSFVLYRVSPESKQFLEAVEFEKSAMDGNEDKLAAKLELLKGCAAVYSQAVGSSAINLLLTAGIQPVKVSEGAKIEQLISDLQNELTAGPSTWVAKAIEKGKKVDLGRFDDMAAEGWDE